MTSLKTGQVLGILVVLLVLAPRARPALLDLAVAQPGQMVSAVVQKVTPESNVERPVAQGPLLATGPKGIVGPNVNCGVSWSSVSWRSISWSSVSWSSEWWEP